MQSKEGALFGSNAKFNVFFCNGAAPNEPVEQIKFFMKFDFSIWDEQCNHTYT